MQGTRRKTLLPFLGIILFLFFTACHAQKSRLLKDLIPQIEQRFDVKFSYLDEDLNGIELPPQEYSSLANFLEVISAETELILSKINERYYSLVRPQNVSICGRVLDNFAKNTVPGATVELLDMDRALVTDIDGYFKMDNVPRGAMLKIRYLGYIIKFVPVDELSNTEGCTEILLAERREILEEVVVYQFLTSGITKNEDASILLNTADLGILPGLIEPDVLQTVQALPGIKSIDETVSDINVRGGTNDQNLILWNGIKIYQSGHFFGLISAFNPYLIKDVRIYKNGTPTQFGDGVSSVISMKTNNELDGVFNGGAGISLISGDVFGQIPIRDNLEFQFSGRRSATDFLNTPTYNSFTERAFQDSEVEDEQNQRIAQNFDREEDFYFYDFSGKVLYDLNEDHKIRFSFIVMDNDLDYNETNTNTNETTRSFLDQTNISAGIQWLGKWSAKFSAEANVYFSKYNLMAIGIQANQIQQLFQENEVDERALKFDTKFEFSDKVHWNNGFEYIETGITNISDVTQPPFQSNITSVIRKYAPFSQFAIRTFEDRFIASAGVRFNYLLNLAQEGASFNKVLIEPRLNLNFRMAKHLRAQILGEFKSQTTNQIIDLEQNFLGIEKRRWILSDNELLPITQSKQASIGLNYDKNGFYFGLEGFYKRVDGISVLTQGFQNEGQFNGDEIGSYDVRGVELLLNKKGENTSTWLGYTYNKNDYTFDGIPPNSFPNNLDVRHTITLATTYDLRNLKLGLGLNYRTGKPFTEPDETDPLDDLFTPNRINYKTPNSSRLPEYFRMDASATYKFNIGRTIKANAGVSLLNLTNRKNILNKYYRVSNNSEIETIENQSLGITPNFSFRVSF
ncbi:TonB-dependent receptor [Croceivirga thetidis]|uniref:TonB-dependent receptor n=1 Tax=Croceivirga thetidis TaxID=2721623 RepID=A0ABX1GTA1_9FLAO|nr:carboxypeptidase-like regulatory domain-containing protein [Croceivirga thetidis]NKI33185.1 TonB-dependent receptor [Croceivirga thetidis]